MPDKVYLYKCSEYGDEVFSAVERIFYGLGSGTISEGMTVIVKANLLSERSPDRATTTHPVVVEAVCREIKKLGATAVICDSPSGFFSKNSLKAVYRVCGMDKAARNSGASLNFDVSHTNLKAKIDGRDVTFPILNAVLNADAIVDVAKAKTHTFMYYTGAVKNMFGCIPGLTKATYHMRRPQKNAFASMIVDLCETIRPKISITDAVVAMEGNGPSNGTPRSLGFIGGSLNPHALDLAVSDIIGYHTDELPILAEGIRRGLVVNSVDLLDIEGDDIKELRVSDFKYPDTMFARTIVENIPDIAAKTVTSAVQPHPSIKDNCRGCGECVRDCPAGAMRLNEKRAEIDYKKCIKCFCCQEVCPFDAVKVSVF